MSPQRPNILRLVAVSIPVVLVCLVLGAFGGCDLALVQAARAGKPDGSTVFILCLAGALVAGLAVSFWDASAKPPSSPVRRRFALRSAYAAAWLMVAVLSFRGDWSK